MFWGRMGLCPSGIVAKGMGHIRGWLLLTVFSSSFAASSAAPPNDALADAIRVSGSEFTIEGNLRHGTSEEFEVTGPFAFRQTAWWTWVAEEDGFYEWDTSESPSPTRVSVYRRDFFHQLNLEASSFLRAQLFEQFGVDHPPNLYLGLRADPHDSFAARAGDTFCIQVDGAFDRLTNWYWHEPDASVPVVVKFRFSAPLSAAPSNDAFSSRTLLSEETREFGGSLRFATLDAGEPLGHSAALGRTRWWSWRAPGTGTATIRSLDTNQVPLVAIYRRGTLNHLELAASSAADFGNGCYQFWRGRAQLDIDVTSNEVVEIQVDRFPEFQQDSEARLTIGFTPAPTNDVPESAMQLEGTDLRLTVSNVGATRGTNEPTIPNQPGTSSVWFHWRAPQRGLLQVTTNEPIIFEEPHHESHLSVIFVFETDGCGIEIRDLHPRPEFAPVFGLFSGTLQGSTPPDVHGKIEFWHQVWQGDYYLFFDGDQGTTGTTRLNLHFTGPPSNDAWTNRIVLPSEAVRVVGRTVAATGELEDPSRQFFDLSSERTVWWEWTAPTAGPWTFEVARGAGANLFVAYRGRYRSSEVAGYSRTGPFVFMARAEEVFQFAVYSLEGFGSNVEFIIRPTDPPVLSEYGAGWRIGQWGLAINELNQFRLPFVFETSTNLRDWSVLTNTPVLSLSSRFVPLNLEAPAGFVRLRLLTHP